jgi:hypothetical protein
MRERERERERIMDDDDSKKESKVFKRGVGVRTFKGRGVSHQIDSHSSDRLESQQSVM